MSHGLGNDDLEQFFTAKTNFFARAKVMHFSQTKVDKKKEKEAERAVQSEGGCSDELRNKVDAYNKRADNGSSITLVRIDVDVESPRAMMALPFYGWYTRDDQGVYTGFIRVRLSLSNPVSVNKRKRPPSIYDVLRSGGVGDGTGGRGAEGGTGLAVHPVRRRTSFYLPPNVERRLHVSGTTTVGQVIEALLQKYMVVDNARKFALYVGNEDGKEAIRRLKDAEHPLALRLAAGPDTNALSFIMKEVNTGDVVWDAFSVPELNNFLDILRHEEQKHLEVMTRKYTLYRKKLTSAIADKTPK
uniref:ras association domain-containing protein 3-like isoform X2 n=1 Tax=Myxine glutinosa TaxID=7769 RepID=UPI00358EAA89